MEADMLHAAGNALLIILDPIRLLYLFGGVCMGLGLGILPGIGGVAGTALLLPFTFNMDAPAAFALLLGLGATTTTADPISAILFGAPGHAASAATALDGYPMTCRGEAGRALGASYMSALIGGLFGPYGNRASPPASNHSLHGVARAAGDLSIWRLDGVFAVGQLTAARCLCGLLRDDAVDDRYRSTVGNAALDHGQPLSLGWDAVGAGDARNLCAA
jgi:Tripartite tricarboxylate transporter TctA family